MNVVIFTEKGTNDLAIVCLNHPTEWADIDAAERDIVHKLKADPLHSSQEVSEGLRRIISWPLVAYFAIDGNRVEVDGVGWIK